MFSFLLCHYLVFSKQFSLGIFLISGTLDNVSFLQILPGVISFESDYLNVYKLKNVQYFRRVTETATG